MAIDYTKQKFEDVAKDVAVVVDSVGGDTLERAYGVAKKDGFIATLVSRLDQAELDKDGIRGASIWAKPDSAELGEIAALDRRRENQTGRHPNSPAESSNRGAGTSRHSSYSRKDCSENR